MSTGNGGYRKIQLAPYLSARTFSASNAKSCACTFLNNRLQLFCCDNRRPNSEQTINLVRANEQTAYC